MGWLVNFMAKALPPATRSFSAAVMNLISEQTIPKMVS